ncbi:MAG TPA: hypothetical protein DCZ95_08870 [Verrucomicrobia bacterium]|nr:MAG: hypothetical protein A2X46_19455 [Lentisphaerae bacterium GWF2_57_35]HBA84188.1 hypothetical protein [Verrucomicrobiota bacterium]
MELPDPAPAKLAGLRGGVSGWAQRQNSFLRDDTGKPRSGGFRDVGGVFDEHTHKNVFCFLYGVAESITERFAAHAAPRLAIPFLDR